MGQGGGHGTKRLKANTALLLWGQTHLGGIQVGTIRLAGVRAHSYVPTLGWPVADPPSPQTPDCFRWTGDNFGTGRMLCHGKESSCIGPHSMDPHCDLLSTTTCQDVCSVFTHWIPTSLEFIS